MKLERRFGTLLLLAVVASSPGRLWAGDTPAPAGEARDILVMGRNPRPGFLVRVDADRSDRTYLGGEKMTFTVRSERSGYLYLIAWNAKGEATCLFPNEFQKDNHIKAGENVMVPARDATFDLEVGPPYGAEVVKAVVTTEPIKGLPLEELVKDGFTRLEGGRAKTILVKLRKDEKPNRWGEHHIIVYTADPSAPRPKPQGRRVGLFVGVGKFRSKQVFPLTAPANDARGTAESLNLDEAIVLVDEEATLAGVERAFRERIVAATRPGDVVFFFWSGHGGRSANTDGEEKDGYDEYLVPYDGDPQDSQKTMLTDNTFGRWLQELDGRVVVVILDACHSAGQHTGAKGVKSVEPQGHLFEGVARRLTGRKDLNQKEVAFLASSTAAQISMERRDGKQSVMTHYLIEKIRTTNGPLGLAETYAYLKEKVPAYVEKYYQGSTQTPVLIDQTTPPLYLKK